MRKSTVHQLFFIRLNQKELGETQKSQKAENIGGGGDKNRRG